MKCFLSVLLATCIASAAYAQRWEPQFFSADSLEIARSFKGWLCHDGDNPHWALPGFNDSGWTFSARTVMDVQTDTPIRFSGIAWFRKRIRIDSSLVGVPLALQMRHDGASQIFLDGERLTEYGTLTPRDSASYYDPQYEPFPFVFREAGEHVIAVRYDEWSASTHAKAWGERLVSFSLLLHRAERAIAEQRFEAMMQVGVGMSLAILFGTLWFIHLLLWLYHRSARGNFPFAVLSFCLGLLFYFLVVKDTANDPAKIAWTARLLPYVCLTGMVALSGFINSLFARSQRRFRVLAGFGVLSALLIALPLEIYGVAEMLPFLLFVAVVLETILLTVRAIFRRVPGARIIGAGILLFCFLALVGVLVGTLRGGLALQLNPNESPILFALVALSILAIPISMSAYLAWNFANVSKRLKAELLQVESLSKKARAQEEEKQRMLESRQEELGREVALRTKQLRSEKQKSDELLLNILPEEVADELKEKGFAQARLHDDVTVLFTDFVDFTRYSEKLTPAEIVAELDNCFKAFDEIITRHGLEKIKTIGDAYMAVAGLPVPHPDGAAASVRAALDIRDYIFQRRAENPESFDIRIGVHSGPVVAGIIGVKKFAYDVWGDTVNTASRMEQSSEAGKVNISDATHALVGSRFECSFRGEVAVKGKGLMGMYFVNALVEQKVAAL